MLRIFGCRDGIGFGIAGQECVEILKGRELESRVQRVLPTSGTDSKPQING